MEHKILKLLGSSNMQDVALGWELLISINYRPTDVKGWFIYLDHMKENVRKQNGNFTGFCNKLLQDHFGEGCIGRSPIYEWRKTWTKDENF